MTTKVDLSQMKNLSSSLAQKVKTHLPVLDDLKTVVEKGLKKNYKEVNVEVVPCPDFSKEPFNMTGSGIGQHLRVAEIGGLGNLYPKIHTEKFFDLKECELPKAFVFGPGAGPWHLVGKNSEAVADANFTVEPPFVNMHIAKLDQHDQRTEIFGVHIPNMCLMANLAVSDGSPSQKVLKVTAKVRINDGAESTNFPLSIQQALHESYPGKLVSLCGVFLLKKGKAKMHVMYDFPPREFKDKNESGSEYFLKFFEMNAPLVCASVFHSYDPGLDLRLEHTHCFSEHGDGGHYHYDTTPSEVEYEGYFLPAEELYRIDRVPNP